jgi:hypothetical protein
LKLHEADGTTTIDAVIDVKDVPQHLHQYILLMMRSQMLYIPREMPARFHKEERSKKRPWWRFW